MVVVKGGLTQLYFSGNKVQEGRAVFLQGHRQQPARPPIFGQEADKGVTGGSP